MQLEAIQHAREVRNRLRNPANAKPDLEIDLRPKPIVIECAAPEAVPVPIIRSPDEMAFGPIVYHAPRDSRPKCREVAQIVADHFGIGRTAMISSRRDRKYCTPRQIAMYLCHILTLRSYPEIGRGLGNRDHSTIINGVRKIQGRISGREEKLIGDVDALYSKITAIWPECAVVQS